MPDPLQRLRRPYQQAESMDSASGLGLSGTSSSASVVPSSAPTPYNTFIDTQVYSTASGEEYEHLDEPPIPFESSERPFLASVPSDTSTTSYPATPSVQSEAHLLRLSSSDSASIPLSTRPVPAPPQVRHPTDGPMSSSHISISDRHDSVSTSLNSKDLTPHEITVGHAPVLKQEEVDALRLQQLGYDQVLGRDYTFWSSLAISTINIGCLQGVIFGVYGAYRYGGPMMLLVAWPLSGLFGIALTLALAEQASAYPVSGAMASWAWKLARGGIGGERGWGWLMGGVVLGGHVGNALLVTWQNVMIIQGVMEMAFDYQKKAWHSVCFFLAIIFLCGFVGSTGWGRSHRFWLTCGAYAICVYLILNVSLITTVAKNPSIGISTSFSNTTGWSSRPYVYILGWQFTSIACGADASAHMAEETQKPSRNVPNAMVCSMIVSYVLGYLTMILMYLAVRSDDLTAIAAHDFPFGHILEYAINRSGAIGICSLLIVLLVMQVHAQLQASSRFVFHLARDNAMPLSDVIQRTNSSKQPTIASWVVAGLCVPFCLLTITRKGTLYSVLAVTGGSLSYAAYIIPVILYLWSGKDLQTEGRTSWSLRRFSKPVAVIGILFGCLVIITQMFPSATPVTARNISWSPVVLAGTGLTCLLTWFLYGNKHYSGPIRALTKWETGMEIDLQSALASQRSRPTNSVGNGSSTPKNAVNTFGEQGGSSRVIVESADESVWTDATASDIDERFTERSRHTPCVTFARISEEHDGR